MSQSISRRSFLKCAGSGAVSLAAALLTGVSAAAQQPHLAGEPALLDGKAAVELLGYALRRKWAMCWCTSRWKTSPHPPCRWAQAICRAVRCARLVSCTVWAPALPLCAMAAGALRQLCCAALRRERGGCFGVHPEPDGRPRRCCTASAQCRTTGRRWS